jgi:hypothetical protein
MGDMRIRTTDTVCGKEQVSLNNNASNCIRRYIDRASSMTSDTQTDFSLFYSAIGEESLQSRTAVCKFRGLTLLLRVGTLWRCGDGLFFEVPPLAGDPLLQTLHPLLENGVTVVLKEPFLEWRRNLSGASALRD